MIVGLVVEMAISTFYFDVSSLLRVSGRIGRVGIPVICLRRPLSRDIVTGLCRTW